MAFPLISVVWLGVLALVAAACHLVARADARTLAAVRRDRAADAASCVRIARGPSSPLAADDADGQGWAERVRASRARVRPHCETRAHRSRANLRTRRFAARTRSARGRAPRCRRAARACDFARRNF
ncbi:MAG TPA: hypothetical protein VKV16_01720 [Solirubrobacteraceae bacterium]|nr:hypothetical protein [Solirubrobacteraceae bacterium]